MKNTNSKKINTVLISAQNLKVIFKPEVLGALHNYPYFLVSYKLRFSEVLVFSDSIISQLF